MTQQGLQEVSVSNAQQALICQVLLRTNFAFIPCEPLGLFNGNLTIVAGFG